MTPPVIEATDTLYGDETYDTEPLYGSWIPKDEWVTIAKDRQLSSMTNVTAHFDGGGMNEAHKNKIEPIQFLKPMGDGRYEGQFHHKSGWNATPNQTQCVLVEFRQNGADVQMRGKVVGLVGTNQGGVNAYGTTELSINGSLGYSTATNVSHYGIHDVRPYFTSTKPAKLMGMGRYPGIRNMAGSADGPGGVATVIVKGTDNTKMRYAPAAGNGHVLPYTDGLLRVQNGGEAVQLMSDRKSTSVMWVDDRARIYIEQGGVYRQQSNWGVGVKQTVDISGGEYSVGEYCVRDVALANQGRNRQCALNLLTLSGGVQLHSLNSGDYVYAGSTNGVTDAIWTVRGTSASICDIPLRLWAASSGGKMVFAVRNVADGSDFVMNGAIDVDPSFPNVTVCKTGPGTMQLNKSCNISGKPTLLKSGTWLLNGSSLTSAADPYTLDGGTLAVADGTANSLGVLTVGENGGGITLGAGAMLSFADSSAAEWTGETTDKVIITGFAEKSIRFGTARDGLATAQRLRLRTSDDRRLFLDADGYLTAAGPGTVFSFR